MSVAAAPAVQLFKAMLETRALVTHLTNEAVYTVFVNFLLAARYTALQQNSSLSGRQRSALLLRMDVDAAKALAVRAARHHFRRTNFDVGTFYRCPGSVARS